MITAMPTRRSFLAGSLAAAAAGCVRTLPGAEPPVSVPLLYDATGTLMLDAIVGGAPRRLLLDTGAERSALATAAADALGLTRRAGEAVEGSAGTVASETARAVVEVPGTDAMAIDFTVYPLAWQDPACVGILGAEWLRRAPFALHYRERRLAWRARRPAATLPLRFDHGIPEIEVAVGAVGLTLRLDTGASLPPGPEFYVNVTEAEARRLGLTGAPLQVWSATGTGGAQLELPVHRLPPLRLGARELAPSFAIVQPAVGYFARPEAKGFLGNAVLDKLDPFFDYAARQFGICS